MCSVFQARSGAWVALSLVVVMLSPRLAAGADPNDPNAASSTNSVSATTFDVSGGTPGSWVEAAITRHQAFTAARVNAARNGERPGVQWSNGTTDATTSTDSSSSSLSALLSQYGSSSGTLDSLSSLLSTLTGTSSSTTSTTAASKSSATQQNASNATSPSTAGTGAADAAAPFCGRLAGSLLDAFLSALTGELQSTDFLNYLMAQLEPLVYPPAQNPTSGTSTGG
jgi:hypothetical protein